MFHYLGFKFIDETHNRNSNHNNLKYQENVNGIIVDHYIHFSFDTGVVSSYRAYNEPVLANRFTGIISKNSFMEHHKDIFRQVKLNEIIPN